MDKKDISFGFDIVMSRGSILKPESFHFWDFRSKKTEESELHKPLKYYSDALVGFSAALLNPELHNWVRVADTELVKTAWENLEAHHHLRLRSTERVKSLATKVKQPAPEVLENFEKSFNKVLKTCFRPWGFELKDFWALIDLIDFIETEMRAPLLFNLGVNFSKDFHDKLQYLYSFLWNLRTLVAVDHNAHIDDPSHEALKMDSITDYLPKSDYVVNDALLYWHLKKLTKPFRHGRDSDVRVEKLLIEPLIKNFHQYSHNASYLIDNLPEDFLQSMNPFDLEEALFLVQMDWLLGSDGGLLFKIREELFGLQNGYEKIFWSEWDKTHQKHQVQLSVGLKIRHSEFTTPSVAAG